MIQGYGKIRKRPELLASTAGGAACNSPPSWPGGCAAITDHGGKMAILLP